LSLFGVIRGGDSFEDFEFSEGDSSLGGFVGQHTSHSLPEDFGGGSVMLQPSAGVGSAWFVQEFVEFYFVSEKRSRSKIKLIMQSRKGQIRIYLEDLF
jgi:hypothetical protein